MFFLYDVMLTLWLIKPYLVYVCTENSFGHGFCWHCIMLGWIWPAGWFLPIPDTVNDFIHVFNIFMQSLCWLILHVASFCLPTLLCIFAMLRNCALTFYTVAAYNTVRKIQRSRDLWYWDLLSRVSSCSAN